MIVGDVVFDEVYEVRVSYCGDFGVVGCSECVLIGV